MRKKSYSQSSLRDVLNVQVVGYVVTYWHSRLPVLKSVKFKSKSSLMRWIEQNKASLFINHKPVFSIESIMQVVNNTK